MTNTKLKTIAKTVVKILPEIMCIGGYTVGMVYFHNNSVWATGMSVSLVGSFMIITRGNNV